MAENSGISWTDHTFNPWIGCTKVSPGCDHCYAETWAKRYGTAEWGTGQPRHLTSESNWNLPRKWNREAEKNGVRYRVFCASLADVFDNEVPEEWRVRLWELVYATPHLDWLILTKRIGNARHMLPLGAFRDGPLPNLWLGASIVNQEEADRDIPKLLDVPARVRFLSMEPLLGPVDLSCVPHPVGWRDANDQVSDGVDPLRYERACLHWVIVGGESGSAARPMHPDWARSLRDQCIAAGVAFHFKQWGEWHFTYDRDVDDPDWKNCPRPLTVRERYVNLAGGHGFHGERVCFARRLGKKMAGRLLDGREWNELPKAAA